MLTVLTTVCFNCAETGHFAKECPHQRKARTQTLPLARLPQYARPGANAGVPTFVDGVHLGWGLAELGQPTDAFLARLQDQVQAQADTIQHQKDKFHLQDMLLEARELIKRQAEMLEHSMRTESQPPGLVPACRGDCQPASRGCWGHCDGRRCSAASTRAHAGCFPQRWGDSKARRWYVL
jgi:hypothetical protein